jgi:predicted DNA-binding transcriptional regulator AlpA
VTYEPPDPLLTAEEAATEVHLSLAAFWRSVQAGRLPRPLYPASRAPRWRRSELHTALDRTRALPAVQKASRRVAMQRDAVAVRRLIECGLRHDQPVTAKTTRVVDQARPHDFAGDCTMAPNASRPRESGRSDP